MVTAPAAQITSPVGGVSTSQSAAGGLVGLEPLTQDRLNASPRHRAAPAAGSVTGNSCLQPPQQQQPPPPSSSSSSSNSRTSKDARVCPNDRQLALMAKLQSGWSAKTADLNQWKQPEPISNEEQEAILKVIEKAAALERAEQERVG